MHLERHAENMDRPKKLFIWIHQASYVVVRQNGNLSSLRLHVSRDLFIGMKGLLLSTLPPNTHSIKFTASNLR
jgi:predicted Na+-dependent transporter